MAISGTKNLVGNSATWFLKYASRQTDKPTNHGTDSLITLLTLRFVITHSITGASLPRLKGPQCVTHL